MAFVGDALVFPGGRVDDRDTHRPARWRGPSPNEWAAVLQTTPDQAAALVCAAVRELFEEAAILLASPDGGSVLDAAAVVGEADRRRVESGELPLGRLLDDRGLTLRADLLAPWRCWLTPAFEPRRYRTWFFVAVADEHQRGQTASGESTESVWLSPAQVLALAGERYLVLPPQFVTCAELAAFDSAAAVMASARTVRRREVFPQAFCDDAGEVRLRLPQDLLSIVAAATG
jgi:8-oxo-dGTP pyrophosphatase MutT (NUDIX family)